jgi:orotate phosphoribosyltransferase-like protein
MEMYDRNMAHRELKQRAIELRQKGYSYSQIKAELGLSKSTLSNWLYDMPLSEERIKYIQDTFGSDCL